MKRILPILLIFTLALPYSSTYLYFKQRQYVIRKSIKRQIKKGVSEKDLVLLKIPKWIENSENEEFKRIHSKEFRYKGEMYDIVRSQDYGNETWYWCVWDKEETALFAQLDELFDKAWNKDPAQQQTQERLMQFFHSIFDNHEKIQVASENSNCITVTSKTFMLLTGNRKPDIPPPKTV